MCTTMCITYRGFPIQKNYGSGQNKDVVIVEMWSTFYCSSQHMQHFTVVVNICWCADVLAPIYNQVTLQCFSCSLHVFTTNLFLYTVERERVCTSSKWRLNVWFLSKVRLSLARADKSTYSQDQVSGRPGLPNKGFNSLQLPCFTLSLQSN